MALPDHGVRLVEKNTFLEVLDDEDIGGKVLRTRSWHCGDEKSIQDALSEEEATTSVSEGMGPHTLLDESSQDLGESVTEQVAVVKDPPTSHMPPTITPLSPVGMSNRFSQHNPRTCKPCVFALSRGGCPYTHCGFCHIHPRYFTGRRPRKEIRERLKEMVHAAFNEVSLETRRQLLQDMAQQNQYMCGIIVGRLDQEDSQALVG